MTRVILYIIIMVLVVCLLCAIAIIKWLLDDRKVIKAETAELTAQRDYYAHVCGQYNNAYAILYGMLYGSPGASTVPINIFSSNDSKN